MSDDTETEIREIFKPKKFKDLPPAEKGLLEMVLPTNIISNTGST